MMLPIRLRLLLVAAALICAAPLSAQLVVPDIPFESNPEPLKFPDALPLGEAAGVARNSQGHVFVYMRTGNPTATLGLSRTITHGGTRLVEFDQTGTFVREIGQGIYGFLFAQQVRVDRDDNIWTVDRGGNIVIKFSPEGRVLMTIGRKPEAVNVPGAAAPPAPTPQAPAAAPVAAAEGRAGGPAPGSGVAGEQFNRPTDVAWDSAGNIYIADGYGNARVVKYDRNGKYLKHWGSRGSAPGQFDTPHGIAVDAQGNVYVADRGNRRIQVFDGEGTFKAQFLNVGAPSAICITPGPRQFLYASNSNPPDNIDYDGEIYKLDLSGRIIGRFGRAGKLPKEFGTVNAIDCRSENDLYVGETGNWRVQRIMLKEQ
jgi:DNA-binding beta-propeller fold protein YncE